MTYARMCLCSHFAGIIAMISHCILQSLFYKTVKLGSGHAIKRIMNSEDVSPVTSKAKQLNWNT